MKPHPPGVGLALALIVLGSGLVSAQPDEPMVKARGIVAGLVIDSNNQPIAGAEVVGAFDPGLDPGEGVEPDLGPQARTDASGRFRLDWPDLATGCGSPTVWVVRDGFRLGRVSVPPWGTIDPVVVSLRRVVEPASALVAVDGPRGEAIRDTLVRPTHTYEGDVAEGSPRVWAIPRSVADRLAVRTDAGGRAVLGSVPALRLARVEVESPFGTQAAWWADSLPARNRLVTLRGVGRVTGRVEAKPGAGANLRVRVTTRVNQDLVARADTLTDESGRFAVAKVASGRVEVQVEPRPGSPNVAAQVVRGDLEPGGVLDAPIPLERGVRVRGMIVERGSGTPVAGAWVTLLGSVAPVGRRTQTDSAGRFAAVVAPGPVAVELDAVPFPGLTPRPRVRTPRVEARDEETGYDWPTIEVDRGVMLRGQVVDPDHRTAGSKVVVVARWTRRDERGRINDPLEAEAATGRDGRFALGPIPSGVDLTLNAHRSGGLPSGNVLLPGLTADQTTEIRLPGDSPWTRPEGWVVDAAGRPVANALVQLRVVDPTDAGLGPKLGHRITSNGTDAIVTDVLGHWRGPEPIDPAASYLASAEADECDSAQTEPVVGRRSDSRRDLHFPVLVIDRPSKRPVVVGRVVGTDGQPIPGAVIRDLARDQTVTNEAGWFRLEASGVGAPSFLFAQRDGYRFFGRALRVETGDLDRPLTVTLIRSDEPANDRSMTRSAGGFAGRGLAAALIRSWIVHVSVGRVLARGDLVATSSLLEHLAKVDSGRVERWLKAGLVADPRVADGLRRGVARHLASADYARAESVLAAIESPEMRGRATLEALAAARSLGSEARRRLIERVERDSRSVEDLDRRVILLGLVAESWLDLGDEAAARRTLGDAESMAETLPRATTGTQAWCALIQPLARLDSKRARAHLDRLVDPVEADACRLRLARNLARTNPTEAIHQFRRIRDQKLVVSATPELCHRLAPANPALARSLLDPIHTRNPAEAAYALGMIAASLAETNRPAARDLVREAFARLEALVESGAAIDPQTDLDPAVAAATLLPTVEAIDPALVPEYFWKSVSLHARPTPDSPRLRAAALLALMLDRYDRTAARLLFDPSQVECALIPPEDFPPLLVAAARLAPAVAFQWTNHPTAGPRPATRDQRRINLITALTLSESARFDHAARHHLHLWTPEPALPARP